MPLLKSSSKEAFVSNFKKELSSGKPKKQALAIAYSVKRKSGGSDALYHALGKKSGDRR